MVDKVKAVYPEIAKLSNDELRAKTVELKKYISDSAAEEQKKIEELKGTTIWRKKLQTVYYFKRSKDY